MTKQKEVWVDSVKIFACILVVLGHFFQSMNSSNVFQQDYAFIGWFNNTVYLFHVPLFFICSGYLYQNNSCVLSIGEYKNNIVKKLVSLGIPYLFFSFITWAMKNVFSGSVNIQADGLFYSLFLKPISPYWYLYALFLIFLITPTFKNKKITVVGLVISLIIKCLSFIPFEINVYAVSIVFINHIWFAIGMCLSEFGIIPFIKEKLHKFKYLMAIMFVLLSVALYAYRIENEAVLFAVGFFGCVATLFFAVQSSGNSLVAKISANFSKYTLPVYLMHTIFAAGVRIVLLKLNITSSIIHVSAGLAASFAGPVIAAEIMSKFKVTEFFLYPLKYIRFNRKTEVRQCPKS